jgi:short-subunit dehydrogenase
MNVVVIGATSAIAHETARIYAAQGAQLVLAGRNQGRIEDVRNDLVARGAALVEILIYDFADSDKHSEIAARAATALGTIDLVLIAHGTLPEQSDVQDDFALVREVIDLNAMSVISLSIAFAEHLKQQASGTLAVISSVAGDRGRQSNYVYGTAKAAVSTFLSGLRGRLRPHGVQVLTIKPGMVDTPMTAHMSKGALWATPEKIAADIERGVRKKSDVIYTPFFWKWIMLIIASIPERLFKRLRF